MPDDVPNDKIAGSNAYDVLREAIRAVRDIFNDWRVATGLLVLILMLFGKIAGAELFAGLEGLVRAWRCGA